MKQTQRAQRTQQLQKTQWCRECTCAENDVLNECKERNITENTVVQRECGEHSALGTSALRKSVVKAAPLRALALMMSTVEVSALKVSPLTMSGFKGLARIAPQNMVSRSRCVGCQSVERRPSEHQLSKHLNIRNTMNAENTKSTEDEVNTVD